MDLADFEAMRPGEPWPKKKAGILCGVEGRASRAACHSVCVFGKDMEMGGEQLCGVD